MSTSIPLPISMSEYLHTSYQPDCDYVDGIVRARKVGDQDHAELRRALLAAINQHSREWGVRALSEVRIQTSASHVRIANIAVVPADANIDQVIEDSPVAIVEILSPEDRITRHVERIDDYRRMGIKAIWAVDPSARKGFDSSAEEWVETTSFAVPDSPFHIDLAAIFATVDQDRAR